MILLKRLRGLLTADFRLVISGYTTYESECSRQLKQMAKRDGRVVFAGHVVGDDLRKTGVRLRLLRLWEGAAQSPVGAAFFLTQEVITCIFFI